MDIQSMNCPNCGAPISITQGMKQAYCDSCDSLLLIDSENYEGDEVAEVGQDSPLSVSIVPVKAQKIYIDPHSDLETCLDILAGISFLQNTSLPFVRDSQDNKRETFRRVIKKSFFSQTESWPQENEKCASFMQIEDCYKRKGVVYTQKEEIKEREYTIENEEYDFKEKRYVPAGRRREINHIYKYENTKITPDAIKKTKQLLEIISNIQNNEYFKGLIDSIADHIHQDLLCGSFGLLVSTGEDVSMVVGQQKYRFSLNSFSLSNCKDLIHKSALLAIISAGLLKRKGNQWGIKLVSAEKEKYDYGPYAPRYDDLEVDLYRINRIQKEYQDW